MNGYNLSDFVLAAAIEQKQTQLGPNGCFGINAYCRCPHITMEKCMLFQNPDGPTAGTYCLSSRKKYTRQAALIGGVATQGIRQCWIKCGCWSVPMEQAGKVL